jgi:hypothetical protein
MSEQKQTSDPHGGISASGTTADEMTPEANANDYGNTGVEVVESGDDDGE